MAHRNIEVIWPLRHLKPDFRTIATFRRMNRSAFRMAFREFVFLYRQLDLFGRELLAVDGTRVNAVNNKDRDFARSSLAKFVRETDEKPAISANPMPTKSKVRPLQGLITKTTPTNPAMIAA